MGSVSIFTERNALESRAHDAVAQWRSGADIPARAIQPQAGVDVLVESGLLEK